MTLCWVDGEQGACVPADDRGLQYGDGVFRTCLVWGGGVHALERQLAVLSQDADALGLQFQQAVVSREIEQAAQILGQGVLKLMLTRLQQGRGYRPAWPAPARRILLGDALPARGAALWSTGIRARILESPCLHAGKFTQHKHLNRLAQISAQQAIASTTAHEAILLNQHGRVAGGSMSTLFFVSADGALTTPELREGALAGCTRAWVLETARSLGIQAVEKTVSIAELGQAKEVFVTNALIGVWPVEMVVSEQAGEAPKVPAPGSITQRIAASLSHPVQQAMVAAAGAFEC